MTPQPPGELAPALAELDAAFRDALRAFFPPNVQYERERIIASLANPRDIAFVCGLLSEGEYEAAVLIELIAERTEREPDAPVAHLVDEMAYYLRTSIDETWQIVETPTPAPAAARYLARAIADRTRRLLAEPPAYPRQAPPDRAALVAAERARPDP